MSSQTEARSKEIMVTYPGNNFGCALVGKSFCAQAVFRMRSKLYCKYWVRKLYFACIASCIVSNKCEKKRGTILSCLLRNKTGLRSKAWLSLHLSIYFFYLWWYTSMFSTACTANEIDKKGSYCTMWKKNYGCTGGMEQFMRKNCYATCGHCISKWY